MKKHKVTIDVGHGFNQDKIFDPGVVYARDLNEFNLNMFQGLIIYKYLQKLGCDVDIFIYDTAEKSIFLSDRGLKGKDSDVFVSVHHNAYNGIVQGTECCIHDDSDIKDRDLAFMIEREIVSTLGIRSRGIKEGKYTVLSKLNDHKPASCIVESFFMDAVILPNLLQWCEEAAIATSIGIIKFLHGRW